jgi:hypothetical protein
MFKVGDRVQHKSGPEWGKNQPLFVREVDGNRIQVTNGDPFGSYNSDNTWSDRPAVHFELYLPVIDDEEMRVAAKFWEERLG